MSLHGDHVTVTESNRDVYQYIENVEFPVRQSEIVRRARNNGAPDEILERLKGIKEGPYESRDEVRSALGDST